MSTFVLVLFSTVASGSAIATIPDYPTRTLCEEAGKEYQAEWPMYRNFVCIKGPRS